MQLKKTPMEMTSATMNPEKAGGDAGEVGSSLRFKGIVLVDKLAEFFSSEQAYNKFLAGLYGKDDNLIAPDIRAMELNTDMEKVKLTIGGIVVEDARVEFTGCKLDTVVIEPMPARSVKVSFRVYVYPADNQWVEIKQLLRKNVTVSLSGGKPVPVKDDKQTALSLGKGEEK